MQHITLSDMFLTDPKNDANLFTQKFLTINFRALDFLEIFTQIYKSDLQMKRPPGLTRKLRMIISVYDPLFWNSQQGNLFDLLKFVSSDELEISFSRRTSSPELSSTPMSDISNFVGQNKNFKNITLLSGGLDSFCGFLANHQTAANSLYLTYMQKHVEHQKQDMLHSKIKRYSSDTEILTYDSLSGICKKEPSQRTRSLLFIGLAVFTSSLLNIPEILLYENGPLSLHPNLNNRFVTRSTHPNTIKKINILLENANISCVIKNPFFFLPKGRLLFLVGTEQQSYLRETWSCGVSRQSLKLGPDRGDKHCGACIPCVLRKISFASHDLEKFDVEYIFSYNKNEGAHDLDSDYNDSIRYFKKYAELITRSELLSYTHLPIGLNRDDQKRMIGMLEEFSLEVGMYLEKYE